jgi:hypothetical protein
VRLGPQMVGLARSAPSEVEQQLENEPTRDAEKMEQSRTTRMG